MLELRQEKPIVHRLGVTSELIGDCLVFRLDAGINPSKSEGTVFHGESIRRVRLRVCDNSRRNRDLGDENASIKNSQSSLRCLSDQPCDCATPEFLAVDRLRPAK